MPNSIGIEIFVKEFLETAEHPDHRYFSQELCWKYFYSTKSSGCLIKNEKEHNLGSLHLAAYLASWGMYRGSSFLLREKNYLFYEPIVEYLYELDIKCWTIDAVCSGYLYWCCIPQSGQSM